MASGGDPARTRRPDDSMIGDSIASLAAVTSGLGLVDGELAAVLHDNAAGAALKLSVTCQLSRVPETAMRTRLR
jgi:hypothetical protein